jgi:hypothetical protein
MSAPTDATSSNGKAPVADTNSVGFRPSHGVVKVQPARLEDLQPKYAQRIQHSEDNPEAHGWYAGMSELPIYIFLRRFAATFDTDEIVR